MYGLQRLVRIVLICSEPLILSEFYERALGFTRTGHTIVKQPAFAELVGLPGAWAEVVRLCLGAQEIELVGVRPRGRPYPRNVPGTSPLFQHFAIAVPDLQNALARLASRTDWTPISTQGSQKLPAASGGVTAFKFRDPEGHPLELITLCSDRIQQPQINHSAISVRQTARSVEFYEAMGLHRTGGSLNVGIEQDRLDGVAGARVEVTALETPHFPVPHLELLCYGDRFTPASALSDPNDVAATCLVFKVGSRQAQGDLVHRCGGVSSGAYDFSDGTVRSFLRDPDGHWLCLEVEGAQPPVANPG